MVWCRLGGQRVVVGGEGVWIAGAWSAALARGACGWGTRDGGSTGRPPHHSWCFFWMTW